MFIFNKIISSFLKSYFAITFFSKPLPVLTRDILKTEAEVKFFDIKDSFFDYYDPADDHKLRLSAAVISSDLYLNRPRQFEIHNINVSAVVISSELRDTLTIYPQQENINMTVEVASSTLEVKLINNTFNDSLNFSVTVLESLLI